MKSGFVLQNKKLGITSDDVRNCTDILLLEEMIMEQQLDVDSIKMQLQTKDDDTNVKALKSAQFFQGELYSLMKKRLSYLSRQREQLNDYIIKYFKDNTTDEKWEEIVQEAKLSMAINS